MDIGDILWLWPLTAAVLFALMSDFSYFIEVFFYSSVVSLIICRIGDWLCVRLYGARYSRMTVFGFGLILSLVISVFRFYFR